MTERGRLVSFPRPTKAGRRGSRLLGSEEEIPTTITEISESLIRYERLPNSLETKVYIQFF